MNTKELELIIDGKSTKSGWGQTWEVTKCILGFSWCTTKFVAKNTPAALGAVWETKKALTEIVIETHQEMKKEQQINNLNNQIKLLKKD